jgi:general secretion pathway protein D
MENSIGILSVLILAVLLLAPVTLLADTATLSVATTATVPQGSSFSVEVNISSVSDLYDFQFDLAFNPAVLQLTNIVEGGFLLTGGSTFFLPGTVDNTLGNATANADTLIGAIPGVSGTGELAEFDFTAVGPGISSLTLSNVILQDSTSSLLDSTTAAGSVTVQGTTTTVPEPSTLLLLGVGFLTLAAMAVRLNRRIVLV